LLKELTRHEGAARLVAFLLVFGTMAALELVAAARTLRVPRGRRWPRNLGLTLINTVILRLIFPGGATAAALWASAQHFGLLQHAPFPQPVRIVIAIIALDFVIYVQHVAFHAAPLLFRFHRVHHADIDFDMTLGTRFHPVEMVLSMLVKFAAVAALGVPVVSVVIFELILSITSLFSHANVRVRPGIDRVLRWILVTPAMHVIHHSAAPAETDSNFGFNLPWWDRLFGTYRAEPNKPLQVGLQAYREREEQSLGWMLALPFDTAPRRPGTLPTLRETRESR
jgi:sterol desaturase/sphingolipid hydroxylase (fatty acid hydroxylase superfamily)